jgi:hypothetical protein
MHPPFDSDFSASCVVNVSVGARACFIVKGRQDVFAVCNSSYSVLLPRSPVAMADTGHSNTIVLTCTSPSCRICVNYYGPCERFVQSYA